MSSMIEQQFKRTEKIYENGLKHIHFEVPFLKSVTLSFLVKAGSANESRDEQWGIAHFLEHMMFNGSEKYPDRKVSDEIMSMNGIYQNAWTWTSITNYYLYASKDSFEVAFDLLYQRVYKPLLTEKDCKKEIGVIQAEREMYASKPTSRLEDELAAILYKGSYYEHPVIGDKESVGGMNTSLLREFHDAYYSPNNSLFITYGGADFQFVDGIVSAQLGKLKRFEGIPEHKPVHDQKQFASIDKMQEIRLEMDTSSTLYRAQFRLPKCDSLESYLAHMFISTTLGAGEGSLLNQELVVKQGLVSDTSYYHYFMRDGFMVDSMVTFDGVKTDKVKDAYLNLLFSPEKYIDQEQFERAKGYLYGDYLRALEDLKLPGSLGLANFEMLNFLQDTDFKLEEILPAVRSYTLEKMMDRYKEWINQENMFDGFVIPKK